GRGSRLRRSRGADAALPGGRPVVVAADTVARAAGRPVRGGAVPALPAEREGRDRGGKARAPAAAGRLAADPPRAEPLPAPSRRLGRTALEPIRPTLLKCRE